MLETADSSNPPNHSRPGILTGFVYTDRASKASLLPAEARKQRILADVATRFGPKALTPANYHEVELVDARGPAAALPASRPRARPCCSGARCAIRSAVALGRDRDGDRLAVLHRRRDPLRRAGGRSHPQGVITELRRRQARPTFNTVYQRMTPAARLAAAIEVLADIEARRRPAGDALKDWGLSHRFAGSGDRAAIAGLVYDALRRKASAASSWARTRRARCCSACSGANASSMPKRSRGWPTARRFAPPPLTEAERARLDAASLDGAPPWVAGDYPEWLDPHLAAHVRRERAEEGGGACARAPLDLRVNTLKATATRRPTRSPTSRPSRRAGRRWACASCSSPTPKARRSTPSRPSSRA